MTETRIEYGVRFGDAVLWPDEDGDVKFPVEIESARYHPATPEDLKLAVDSYRRHYGEALIVQRTVTISDEVPYQEPLPTTPGSVVQATANGERGLFTLTLDSDGFPWCRVTRPAYVSPNELTDVDVLFTAPEVTG